MPVYPPSSTVVLFHLQLKTLLVPPQGAFSRRCLRSHAAACLPPLLSLSLSPYFVFFLPSSLPPPPHTPLRHLPLSFARATLLSWWLRARASTLRALRALVPRLVVWCRPAVSVRTLRLDRAAQNPTARMREVVASAGESLPRVTSRLYPAPRLYVYIYMYRCTYIARWSTRGEKDALPSL